MMQYMNDSDFKGFGPNDSKLDRFINFFYFNVGTYTSTAYGDILPITNRAKILMAFYMMVVFAGMFTVLYELFENAIKLKIRD
jgi:hypothetical protein